MNLLVNPDIGHLAVRVGDLPMVAGAAVDLFDAEVLAGHTLFAGAGVARVAEWPEHHGGTVTLHLTSLVLHVRVFCGDEDVGGLGLEVGDYDAATARANLHVPTQVFGGEVHFAGHIALHAAFTGGGELHVGR